MSRYKDPWDAYHNDPQLRALVDMLTAYVLQADFTPSEIRQAAMLAAIKAEHLRPTPVVFTYTDALRFPKRVK